jgi:glycosyltransferase involved in cell wall biosynthesis
MSSRRDLAVWFPAVQTKTGTDVFTERLASGLQQRGIRTEITWLPLRAEYAPWSVRAPKPPEWATVVHVNSWLHPRFMPGHLPVIATIHHSMHSPALLAYKGFMRAVYHRWWMAPNERHVLRRTQKVVAVSRFVADTVRRTLLDVPAEVIYNGVDTNRFRPGNRPRDPGASFKLLYVGSWKKLKGVDLLAPIMRALGVGFELRYTGGPAAEQDRDGVPPNMHDIGRLKGEDAVISAMQDADALLFPSRSEGFGLTVAEAMACGLPVITTHCSSLPELVVPGVTGYLCPRDDVGAFVEVARNLAADGRLSNAMSRSARDIGVRCFDAGVMVDAYIDVYRQRH